MPGVRDGELWSRYSAKAHTTDEMDEALASRLADTEQVAYRFTSPSGVVHDLHTETRERGGRAVCAVTDRKLTFVVNAESGIETATLPYTELKTIERESSLLHTKLVVSVWGHGSLRFSLGRSVPADDVVQFVSNAIDSWQRSVAALQDAKQHGSELARQIDTGDVETAADTRESIHDNVQTARESADAAAETVGAAIRERVTRVERELARTRMEARVDRAETLAPTADSLAESHQYDDAHEALERARSHVETALRLAREEGFGEEGRIRSLRADLSNQADELGSKPLERAKTALERAQSDGTLRAWEHALACYRDALTAGWGTDAFEGDTDALRMQVEWLVGTVIRYRRRLADRYEAEGDTFQALAAHTLALDRYETAGAHLAVAARLATQFRAGDASDICKRFWWVATKDEKF